MSNQAALVLFPDTQVLLHYRPIEQFEWTALSEGRPAHIVICLPVIDELDEKKSVDHLKDRARRVLREIETIRAAGGRVRDNVTLEVYTDEARRDDFTPGLNFDRVDHRIIHLVKKFEAANGASPSIVSADTGMRIRAQAQGVKVVEPPDTERLPDVESEDKKRIRQLTRELQEERSRRPRLSVLFVPPGSGPVDSTFELSETFETVDVDAIVQAERNQLQHIAVHQPPAGYEFNTFRRALTPSAEDIEQYNRSLDTYFEELRRHYERVNDLARDAARLLAFDIIVTNDGGTVADDVEAWLTFPDLFEFVGEVGDTHPVLNTTALTPLNAPRPRG